jgi:NAD(P)-dependent dehydrogenase (short-subunit alcohol dehydrogenase family)
VRRDDSECHDVAIVTGGGGVGCGRAIAARFASGGAAVVVSDIDEHGGCETVDLIKANGGRAAFFVLMCGENSRCAI